MANAYAYMIHYINDISMMTLRKVYNYVVVKYIYSKAYSPIELIYIYCNYCSI